VPGFFLFLFSPAKEKKTNKKHYTSFLNQLLSIPCRTTA
jgi:hypothetical protein